MKRPEFLWQASQGPTAKSKAFLVRDFDGINEYSRTVLYVCANSADPALALKIRFSSDGVTWEDWRDFREANALKGDRSRGYFQLKDNNDYSACYQNKTVITIVNP